MKFNDKVYNVLKWVVMIVLPAIATLYITLANIWGLPLGDEVGATISAITTFLGACLMISTNQYNKEQAEKEKADTTVEETSENEQ